jgi:hypothetical protein
MRERTRKRRTRPTVKQKPDQQSGLDGRPAHAQAERSSLPQSWSGGAPLSSENRAAFEPHLGHAIGDVRIHADQRAAEAAEEVNARAFTTGRDIVFGFGEYRPDTPEGQRLLAHELAHVVQQRSARGSVARPPVISTPGDRHEVEANQFARSLPDMPRIMPSTATPTPITPATAAGPFIQRDATASATVPGQRTSRDVRPAYDDDVPVREGFGGLGSFKTESYYWRWIGSYGDLTQYQRNIQTPHGKVWYWSTQESRVPPVVFTAIHEGISSNVLDSALQALLKQLGVSDETVKQFAGPSIDFEQDISESATSESVHFAETAQGSMNTVDALVLLLEDFQKRLSDAHAEIRLSNRALVIAGKHEQAAGLRARGEKQMKALNTGLTVLGSVIDITVNLKTGNPAGVIKPVYDAVSALTSLFVEDKLLEEADALVAEARGMEREDLAERYSRARDNLRHVESMLSRATHLTSRVESDFVRQRGRAEGEFDRTTRGAFRFGAVARGIDLADHTYRIAHETVLASSRAQRNAQRISSQFYRDPWNELYPDANRDTSLAMAAEAKERLDSAVAARTYAADLKKRLGAIRAAGFDALVNAPGTGTPRAAD